MNTIDPNTISFNNLRHDRHELDAEIRALKAQLRAPWGDHDMRDAQYSLACRKAESTQLCILRAYLRGRWHLADHALCQKTAEKLLPQYLRKEVVREPMQARAS